MSDTYDAVIEIPEGSLNKYELGQDGSLFLDWVMPIPFPTNYGSILNTLGGDGDMLDVMLITDNPLPVLCKVKIRPIGVLKMIDNNEEDYKVVAVAVKDQSKAKIVELSDLPPDFKPKVEMFFKHIKASVKDRKSVV